MIIDTHAHYDDEAFNIDRAQLIQSLPQKGVELAVNAGSSIASIDQIIDLAEQYPHLFCCIGIHPSESANLDEERFSWLRGKAMHQKNLGIGEIGLDYYWDTPERSIQKLWFERQLELARELKLPMVIHSRDAAQDTYEIMKAQKAEEIGAIIHCFGYGVEQARQYLSMGFMLGIGGVVTFTNARKLKEVVEYAPIEQLVLETDCPYLSPVPFRGKRNSSLNLTYVAEEIARIKRLDYEHVVEITTRNAKEFYRLP